MATSIVSYHQLSSNVESFKQMADYHIVFSDVQVFTSHQAE
jgi:hypothetical protein